MHHLAEYQNAPIDPESAARLAASGLRLDTIDTSDAAAFEPWLQVEARGFHGARASAAEIEQLVEGLAYRRTTAVWDAASDADSADAEAPVATLNSWAAPMTVPGNSAVDTWLISGVSVSPTHRRRGIARALIEAELRTAVSLGVPVAALTVSEATIYDRFGFSPAVMSADWVIDTRRAKWAGPVASGSLRFVGLEQARELLPALQERVRLLSPGAIEPWPMYWDNRLGLVGDDKEPAKKLLVVRYDSPAGELEGIGVYKVSDVEGDLFGHTLEVTYLVTATDEAAAGLWRFFLDADLVSTVTARQRPVDDSIVWQVSDFRGARKTGERDHLWTRILDVPAALQARGYADSAVIALDVTDPLGFAAGSFTLRVTPDGVGVVTTGAAADATAHAALTVNALSSLYLGGVSAETLVRAGRITEVVPGSAAVIDSVFRSPVTPWLSIWF